MIPHNSISLSKEEKLAAEKVLASGWLAQGEETDKFEADIAKFLNLGGPENVACVSSGSAALYLSLKMLTNESSTVSIPVYTCTSLWHAVKMANATPVCWDIAADSVNVDISKISAWDQSAAIIPHTYGIPVDFSSQKLKLPLIEDCAQSIGGKLQGQMLGTLGDVGVFSFYATKLLTSGGQGGAVVSNDVSIIKAIKDFRDFDCKSYDKQRFNFQTTDLNSAIGRAQLKKLPHFIRRREEIYQQYCSSNISLLGSNLTTDKNNQPVRYRAVHLTKNPEHMIQYFDNKGIKIINPLQESELLSHSKEFVNAIKLSKKTVSLPIYPSLTDSEVEQIVCAILSYYNEFPENLP